MSTVLVDFDGVIHAYSKGWHDGTIYDVPVPGAREGLLKLMENYAVVVCTSRTDTVAVVEWISDTLDLPATGELVPVTFWNHKDCILVTNRKLPAVAIIDDRAVRFHSWEHTGIQLRIMMADL